MIRELGEPSFDMRLVGLSLAALLAGAPAIGKAQNQSARYQNSLKTTAQQTVRTIQRSS
jgi:hypothetical protein